MQRRRNIEQHNYYRNRDAEHFLRIALNNGPVDRDWLFESAMRDKDIGEESLRRAAKELRIVREKKWVWRLTRVIDAAHNRVHRRRLG